MYRVLITTIHTDTVCNQSPMAVSTYCNALGPDIGEAYAVVHDTGNTIVQRKQQRSIATFEPVFVDVQVPYAKSFTCIALHQASSNAPAAAFRVQGAPSPATHAIAR